MSEDKEMQRLLGYSPNAYDVFQTFSLFLVQ